MARAHVELDEERLRSLERLAAAEGQSVAVLVRRAVDAYLAAALDSDPGWSERLEALVARVQTRIPPALPPDEIDEDISAAREEVRAARRAARDG